MLNTSAHRTAAKVPRSQPETLRLASVTPSLAVSDLPRSTRWYRDVLGFHVRGEWKDDRNAAGAVLRAGSIEIIIEQNDSARGRRRVSGDGVRICCSTRQDIDRLAELIRARGGTLAEEPIDRPWGARDFSIVDPDGYRITFAKQAG